MCTGGQPESPEALQKLHAGLEEMRALLRYSLLDASSSAKFAALRRGHASRPAAAAPRKGETSAPGTSCQAWSINFSKIAAPIGAQSGRFHPLRLPLHAALLRSQDSVAAALASIRNEARSTWIGFVCRREQPKVGTRSTSTWKKGCRFFTKRRP